MNNINENTAVAEIASLIKVMPVNDGTAATK